MIRMTRWSVSIQSSLTPPYGTLLCPIYWVHLTIAFKFPKGTGTYLSLQDILEPDSEVHPSLFASEKIQQSRMAKCKVQPFYPSIWHENKGGNVSILPFSCALRAGASYNYLLVNGIRRLSGREQLRLQGYPEDFKIVVSLSQVRKQAGNSVAIPVVTAIAENIIPALEHRLPFHQLEKQLEMAID